MSFAGKLNAAGTGLTTTAPETPLDIDGGLTAA